MRDKSVLPVILLFKALYMFPRFSEISLPDGYKGRWVRSPNPEECIALESVCEEDSRRASFKS